MKNILLVCTGNTCRSPMAEAILDNEVEHHPILEGQIKTESAGTFAFDEAEPTSYAKMVMEEMGLDIDKHEAKQVDEELVEWADLILTMDDSSLEQMEVMFPEETEKMHRLKEYVADDPNNEDVNYNISDPYGEDYDTYMECAKEIEYCIDKLIEKLISTVDIETEE